jgi:hypothetical protein
MEKPQQLPSRVVFANVEALRRELLEKYGERMVSSPTDHAARKAPVKSS